VNKKVLGIAVFLLTVAMLATPCIGMAHETPPTAISGTFRPAGAPSIVINTAGNSDNQFWDLAAPMAWAGGISGACTYVGHLHLKSGIIVTSNDVWTLAAIVDGKSGALTIRGVRSPSGEGHWVIISGTGDLANLHGEGTYSQPNTGAPVYAYTGQVHFDP
jgi:hypothetical protein